MSRSQFELPEGFLATQGEFPNTFFPTTLRIAIVGAGAVGCYYGARLAQAGHEVHFLLRSDLATVRAHGLTIQSCHGDFQLPQVNAAGHPSEIGPVDLVIVALKTTGNAAIRKLLPPLLAPHTLVLTLQNGLGNEECLASLHSPENVLGGVCFTCINRTAPGIIHHSAQGRIMLGWHVPNELPERLSHAEALAGLFRAAGIDALAHKSLASVRWRKLVWNTCFNGLAVAGGMVDCQTLLQDPTLKAAAIDLMTEFCQISARMGYPLPEDYPQMQITVTEKIGAYRPSTLIDFQLGRDVEVESIWGEPVRRAKAAGVACPRLELLYQLLASLVVHSPQRVKIA